MGRSQETFGKKEKEKKRLKKRKDKLAKKEDRKTNSNKGKGLDSMVSYVDEYGFATEDAPDPTMKVEIEADDIVIGIPKKEDRKDDTNKVRNGRVDFFNDSKGFGFIKEKGTGDKYFVHISGTIDEISEGDVVTYELERGMKGMNAVNVKVVPQQ